MPFLPWKATAGRLEDDRTKGETMTKLRVFRLESVDMNGVLAEYREVLQ